MMEYKIRRFLSSMKAFFSRFWLILLAAAALCVALAVCLDPYDCRMAENVTVGGLNVGGMTPVEAYREMKAASEAVLEGTFLEVELPEETIQLSPADTKATLKTVPAVLAAYRAGRMNDDLSIPLLKYLKLDRQYLRQVLAAYAQKYDTDVTPSHYELIGDQPDLEIENQTADTKIQTLELTLGLPTARLDQEDALTRILAVYSNAFAAADQGVYRVDHDFHVDILDEPQEPDLKAILDTLYIPPVDDALDMEKYQVIHGAFGYTFDLDDAAKQLKAASYGETLSIPMEFEEPEIYGDGLYFRDVLGYCETPHTNDENRNNNLRRACESMNGLVLQPGDVFSYNDTLGPRTKENGYLRAGAYSGWELVQAYGGGICQGSSTIYCAALYADLEIVHRKNHGYTVGYMTPGLDATVNWGGPDFQFRNSNHFPVKILAEVSDGMVKVTLLGTEERDYYVEMEAEVNWGSSGVYAKSYKCKYDRETNELISRELEAKSNYAG